MTTNIYTKLMNIQSSLKAPKNQFNSFGKYNYRSCEDILEALKPLLLENKCTLTVEDSIESIGNRIYVKATATIINCEGNNEILQSSAYAREEENKKGMDGSQITGSSSSYARKYALNGLFCIDDTKDADTLNTGKEEKKETKKPEAKKQEPQQKESDLITQAQAKRMFAMSNGNSALVKEICESYGYASSKDIQKKDYEKICNEIERKLPF